MATTVAQHSVATFTSPVNGTSPIDANTVRGNDNTLRSSYNSHDSDPGIHVQSSTLASRPIAGVAGRKWITADAGEYKLWYDDGTRWNEVGNDAVDVSFIADGAIVKGDVLKLTGWNNGQNLPTLGPATVSGDVCFAIASEDVSNGERSFAINTGFLEDVNTSAFSTGDILYPSNAAGPGTITSWFQNTKPTSGNYQMAAYVIRDNASNGVLFVEFTGPRIVERSDNTASTIVLRDASGNFAAGTITAGALTATGAVSAASVTSTGLVTFASLKGTGATTVTNILDEDNMASDSATALATQQSIKAYVDSQVGTVDTLAEILVNGNTSGGTNLIMSAGDTLTVDTIAETTAGAGVTIDSVLLKDDVVNATDVETGTVSANDGTLAVTIANSTGALTLASALADSNLATISSAGKVANSATTADSANTASAIVARDGSGNFSAGTITAALTGNASTATALSSSRTFALTGDVTGSVSSDLTSGASIATTISELPVSKLQDGSARQLLQTDAAGTGVEWTSNVDVPGTLDVTGAATFDSTVSLNGVTYTFPAADGSSGQTLTTDGLGSLSWTSAGGGVTSMADGTESAPGWYFTSDTNTGFYRPGADILGISTGGVAALILDATQNANFAAEVRFDDADGSNYVGFKSPTTVATNVVWTLPAADGSSGQLLYTNGSGVLDWSLIADANIASNAEIAVSKLGNGTTRQLLQTDSAGTGVEWASNIDVPGTLDVTGATTLDSTLTVTGDANFDSGTLFVDVSTNRVGIGTAAPSVPLDVQLNTTNPVAYFGFSQTNSASNGIVKLQSGRIPQSGSDFTGESGLIFAHSGGAGGTNFDANGGYIKSIRTGLHDVTSSANSALTFATTNANTDTERMRIDSSGNVGIGTSSPATTLHVAGDVTFGGAIDETVYNLTGTALDPANGTIQYITLAANTTFTDSLAEGESMTLMIDDGTAYTVTWPTTTWVNNAGSAPTLATTGYTVVVLWKVSTTLYGALVGDGS